MTARALVLVLTVAAPLAAQDDRGRFIRGTVTDSTGRPIPFANLQTMGTAKYVADSTGRFGFSTTGTGEIALRVYRIGYEPNLVKWTPSGDTTVSITLRPIPRTLETVEVEATRTSKRLDAMGFYSRLNDRKKGVGSSTFFTEDDIRQRNPLMISEMMREVPGVRVVAGGSAHRDFQIRGVNNCKFTISVDGTRISPSTTEAATGSPGMSMMGSSARRSNTSTEDIPLDAIMSVNAAGGIEVYPRGIGAPARFPKVGSTCGVVVIWSR